VTTPVPSWKDPLIALRAWPPLNAVTTQVGRAFVNAVGLDDAFLVKHLPRVGVVESTLPDSRPLRLWSRGDDSITNIVFWRGWLGYEPETTPLFYRLAREAGIVFDVGAYVGFHTVLAALANPGGRVHAFEPQAVVFERLERNVALNGLDNVVCRRVAATDREGTVELTTDRGLPMSSTLAPGFLARTEHTFSVEVSAMSLDRYVEEQGITKVDLVKIDTETTEPAVIRGMARTLARDRPDVVCEVLAGFATGPAIEAALRPLGYRFFLLTPDGPQPTERLNGHERWFNHLLTVRSADAVRRLFA
jgi:FkbM family methyltransferase